MRGEKYEIFKQKPSGIIVEYNIFPLFEMEMYGFVSIWFCFVTIQFIMFRILYKTFNEAFARYHS